MNNRKALTKEEIQFYTQRRKQYTQDFFQMSQQFDPKLKWLTKLLIARKQMTAPKNNQIALPQNRKCKVFASMTKSAEVQQKIDAGMQVEACKYNLDPMPKCSFEYSDICSRIQTSMVPIVEKMDKNIQQKIDDLNRLETEKKISHNRPSLVRSETLQQDELQFQEEYIDQMQIKSQRMHNIIERVSVLQRTKAYQEYHEQKPLHHRPIHLQMCSDVDSDQISGYEQGESTKSRREYEALIKLERWKLKDQIEKDKEKRLRLEDHVQSSLQRLGLQKKMFSMKELQEFIVRCQQSTEEVVREFQSERGEHKARKSFLLHSVLSTKQNTYSNTQSRYKTVYQNSTECEQKQVKSSDLMRVGQLSLFNMNKVKGRYNNFCQKFKKATNRNIY